MISMSIPGLGHEVIQFEKLMKRSGEIRMTQPHVLESFHANKLA